jgi:hypothetical protein
MATIRGRAAPTLPGLDIEPYRGDDRAEAARVGMRHCRCTAGWLRAVERDRGVAPREALLVLAGRLSCRCPWCAVVRRERAEL